MTTSIKKLVITVTTITAFMTAFMSSALNVALPSIANEFHSSAVMQGWLATSYLLTTAVLLMPSGKLSDIFGRTLFFKTGITIFTISTLLSGFSINDDMLLVFRFFQGLGSSMMFTTSTAILVSVYPLNERGKVLGINIASVYTGLSVGPLAGGLISGVLGWRFIFYISAVVGVFNIILTFSKLKIEWREAIGEKFDISGGIAYVSALTMIMLGFSYIPKISGIVMTAMSLIIFYIFYRIELKKDHPLFDIKLFLSNKTFTYSNLAALINYSATFALLFLMSLYLQNAKHYSPIHTGLILITQPVMMAVFSPLAGRLSDRIEPRIVSSIGMGILTSGLLVFCFITSELNLAIIVVNLAFIGFGFALFSSPNSNAVMSSVEKKYFGIAASVLSSTRMVGQMFSMAIVIVIFSAFLGAEKITTANLEEFIKSLRVLFIIFSILCFFGIFSSLSRGKIHND